MFEKLYEEIDLVWIEEKEINIIHLYPADSDDEFPIRAESFKSPINILINKNYVESSDKILEIICNLDINFYNFYRINNYSTMDNAIEEYIHSSNKNLIILPDIENLSNSISYLYKNKNHILLSNGIWKNRTKKTKIN